MRLRGTSDTVQSHIDSNQTHPALRVTRTPDAPDGVIAYALKASGFGFETVSALIEHGLAEARLQRACPSVVVVRHRTNEKAK